MLRDARIEAEWIDPPTPEAIRRNDRQRLLHGLLEPVEFDDEDRELAARLMAERSAEDIAAALVHAHRAAMPQAEELIENTPKARAERLGAERQERHRAGFEDVVWFRMDIGRRQNADPRWILPLLCRRGHITRNEIGAIRIGPSETHFQVPRAVAGKFASALERTAGTEDGGEVRIEPSPDSPRDAARHNRKASGPAGGRPGASKGPHRSNDAKPRADRPERGAKKAWPKKPHRKGGKPE